MYIDRVPLYPYCARTLARVYNCKITNSKHGGGISRSAAPHRIYHYRRRRRHQHITQRFSRFSRRMTI